MRAKLRSDFDLIGDVAITYPVWNDAEQSMEPFTTTLSTSENGVAGFATFASVPALARYSVASTHPVYGYAEQSGQLAYDGDLTIHTLQLNKLSTVRGTVYAIDGITPVAGAAVQLQDGRRDPGIVYTQPDGSFVFHDMPAAVSFSVTAEVTQSGIYRTGIAYGSTPPLGGPAPETSLVLRRRGSVEGRVVYADYKVYDPDNPANRVADDTPNDYSDNAPVPLARLWLRELDYPGRSFGTAGEPLTADVGGRFAVSNVFIGSLRASAWSAENQELRGNWTGVLNGEGEVLAPVYIAVGGGGTGSLQVKVVDPNQQYLPIPNAEVRLYRGGLFDLATTDDAGLARFDELPAGSYSADAYSKSLGKSGAGTGFTIAKDQLTDVRILLEFVGKVDGRLTDPMFAPAKPLPGVPVKLTANSFYALTSTDASGLFNFEGIREGLFQLAAKDTESNRWARGQGVISPENRRPYVELELEKTETLHVAVYLPDDTGADSGTLAGPFEMDVRQRCVSSDNCDYHRTLQGNPLTFPSLFIEGYSIALKEIGGAARTLSAGAAIPKGSAADPLRIVYPAFGSAEVFVVQAGAPAAGARIEMWQGGERRSLYADSSGKAAATGLSLGIVTVQATAVDGRFSGSTTINIARQSVPGTGTIELGAYAGISGTVNAETGGPSIGTRVLASFAGRTLEMLTGSGGEYLFQGIPTSVSGTAVDLTYVGPDGVTIGARRTVSITNDWASRIRAIDAVTLDATPPQLAGITPADGAQNVSPDAPVRLVFSEAIQPADLNASNLQLIAADGSGQPPYAITSSLQADKTFAVTLTPSLQAGERFPLRSNTLYRIVVQSALRDLTGHTLPAPRGTTFTTSDYAEPRVVKITPSDKLPLPAQLTLQFHFNEPIDRQSFVFHFYKVSAYGPSGAVIAEKFGNAYVDPAGGLYLAFAPNEEIEPESYYRAVLSNVRDLQGNQLAPQTYHFFSFDSRKPYLRLVSPVPDGTTLVSGVQYTLNADPRSDSLDGPVATDLAQVEYVRIDGATETVAAIATTVPFAYRFAAPEAPEAGISYTIRATATDLSGNTGPPSTISWTVKPNAAPKNVIVALSSASAYPGATVTANVTFEDEGVLAPVQVVMRGTNNDATEVVQSQSTEAKRDSVGQPWPAIALPFKLPVTLRPDSMATFTATVTDVRGLSASAGATLTLLADTIKPVIVSTTPAPETSYNLNAKYRVTATATDAETGVAYVDFVVDGATYRVTTSTNGTFTSPEITATARNVDTRIPITVRAGDYNGNVATRAFDVIYIGVNDPTAPKGAWLCPVDRAVIPASQTSFKLPLRVRAQDDVAVTSVQFRVPGVASLVAANRIGTTDDYAADVTFDTPAAGAGFTVAAIISDANAAHTIELPIAIDVVAFDRVIDVTEAVDADTVSLYEGKSLLVRGTGKLVINVPLAVRNLAVLDGGRLETLGTTLTRERRLDLTVTDRLYVDCTSTVDVTGKGYLGGWSSNPDGSGTRNESPAGRTLNNASGATSAAASHGGLGGANTDGATNAVYGSLADPTDLGSGGAGHPTNTTSTGGTGAGAISLRTSTLNDAIGRVVVAGSIRADASPSGRNGGSGGSIRITARQLVTSPVAQVSANGGTGQNFCGSGADQCLGGSGGRIAITAAERLELAAQLRAQGGANGSGSTLLAGAAGTIYVVRPGQVAGELTVSQIDAISTRATPLANLTVAKLILGPWALARLDTPFDLTKVEKDPTAVLVSPTAVPTATGTTTPANDATLIRNTPLELLLDAASVAGIVSAELNFTAAPPKRILSFNYPLAIDDHRVSWTVPPDAPLGPAALNVKVLDRADRTFETTLAAFTIADNLAPVIDSFTVNPQSLYPGHSVTATLAAHDDVSVTRVTATATIGATTPSAQTRTPNAKTTSETFTFSIPVDTPGGTPMTIEAAVEDNFPGRAATKQLANVIILSDTVAPTVSITAPADLQQFDEAIGTFAVSVTANDAEVAVKSVTAKVGEGSTVPLTLSGAAWTGTLAIPPVDGEDVVPFVLTVTATDYANNQRTATITIRIKPTIDPNAPTVQWTCGKDAKVPAGATMMLRAEAIQANASNPVQKVEFVAGNAPAILATNVGNNVWEAPWTIPAGAATYTINAVATSSGGASRSAKSTMTAVVADQIFTSNATIAANDTSYDNKILAVTAGTLTISGAHTFTDLLILGGSVTHPDADASLRITAGTVYIACDASIDTTGRGYAASTSYPGASTVASGRGGSHIGIGGSGDAVASAYGSIYEPQELGGGGGNGPGGGIVVLSGGTVLVDGAIRANGLTIVDAAGAGGSVFIRTTKLGGSGTIEANGGSSQTTAGPLGGGGGGAVSIEYTDGTLPTVRATATPAQRIAGAGTVYVKGPGSTFGTLTIDNGGRIGTQPTWLPSLGNGIAQTGSGGVTLVTDRAIPPYFARHWIEIEGKGTFRAAAVSGNIITLENGANVAAGDKWQGVYRFDDVQFVGMNYVTSRDPIRVPVMTLGGTLTLTEPLDANDVNVTGTVTVSTINARNLTVAAGATLRPNGSTLAITAANVTVAGTIDVSALGYGANDSYPGESISANSVGGSHIGAGGSAGGTAGSTYGSVDRPAEAGAGGGGSGSNGGGVVTIDATASVRIDGTIRANGANTDNAGSGAGGSVFIRTAALSGSGVVEALGASTTDCCFGGSRGGGGGGAVAVEYISGTLPTLRANAASAPRRGGAGSVSIAGPTSTYGDLVVDNAGTVGASTILPALGSGTAQPGSGGTTLVTDRATTIPAYFRNHFVEIEGKGIWRITAVAAKTITLETGANVAAGDVWRGAYRVDTLRLRFASLVSADIIRYAALDKDAASSLTMNAAAPQFPPALRSQIRVNGDFVVGPAGAVTDADQPVTVTATNTRTAQTFTAAAAADGSFSIAVTAAIGDTFTIRATDAHPLPLSSIVLPVSGSFVETNTIASLSVDPQTVTAGGTAYGSIRLTAAARAGVTVTLTSSSPNATVPASVTIPPGATTTQFPITTSAAAAYTSVSITATLANAKNASFNITPASAALSSFTLSSPATTGGTSVDATAILGAPAPAGGATVLLSSDTPLATIPSSMTIAEGATQHTVTVTTTRVASTTNANLSATYGSTKSTSLALTACASLPAVNQPASIALTNKWVDDTAPGPTTGDAVFDNTQFAAGALSLHFAASTAARSWSFTTATPLPVNANDNLVLYALVNPCNPPRQIAVTWNDGSTDWLASWGESRIAPLATNVVGAVPAGGVWTRLEVPVRTTGVTRLNIAADGGELWIDAVGHAACTLTRQPAPQLLANETVWFDDALPAGAVAGNAFQFESTQAASGAVSDRLVSGEHSFTGATEGLTLSNDDMLVAYLLIDPCNPPREVMLRFHDGSAFSRGVYWGENLIDTGYRHYTDEPPSGVQISYITQRRMGPLPEAGKWVRLEIPVASMQMTGMTIRGLSFSAYDGAVWLDRVAKLPRINLALGKTATQSSTNWDNPDWVAAKGVDGVLTNFTHTVSEAEAWWQVDLGAVQPIDSIDVWNGGGADCCLDRMSKFWVFVSDVPFTSTSLNATLNQPGVSAYYHQLRGWRPSPFEIGRSGRYVRVQLSGSNFLQVAELQVWAPVSAMPVNLASGRPAVQSSTNNNEYAAKAVNGSSIGFTWAHTVFEAAPWWQVDLGSVQWISGIDVDNTIPGFGARVADFYLFVSDTPFTSTSVADTLNQPGVSAYYRGPWRTAYTYGVNRTGRYLRLQLTGTNYLDPIEVKVWSPFLTLPPLLRTPKTQ